MSTMIKPNLDRFAVGLPDPQDSQPPVVEPIDECNNDECRKPIYLGQRVWKIGPDLYCSTRCFVEAIGGKQIKA